MVHAIQPPHLHFFICLRLGSLRVRLNTERRKAEAQAQSSMHELLLRLRLKKAAPPEVHLEMQTRLLFAASVAPHAVFASVCRLLTYLLCLRGPRNFAHDFAIACTRRRAGASAEGGGSGGSLRSTHALLLKLRLKKRRQTLGRPRGAAVVRPLWRRTGLGGCVKESHRRTAAAP